MKIVIAEPIGLSEQMRNEYNSTFADHGHKIEFFDTVPENEQECIQRCRNAEIVVISTYMMTSSLLSELPSLKMIAVAFTGYDHVDIEYCRENGISVSNAAGYSTTAVAEQTVLMILSLIRNAREMESKCRALKGREGYLGKELEGMKVGIIGYGLIGQKTAQLLTAFGCEILLAERNTITESSHKQLPLDELLAEADIISLHIPMTAENEMLINSTAISKMKNSALIINTARGGVVDSEALADALNSGKISGAAIDIFEVEPPLPATHPLLNAKNCMIMPHTAYATVEAMEKRSDIVLKNIVSWLIGKGGNVIA
ncbi:MAG: hydroxyacid dehydrogenase [Marinilabiliales bacterium]|nr:MAG: hydroxyacid dehydrogenase [Marinilabiliales bacterium]